METVPGGAGWGSDHSWNCWLVAFGLHGARVAPQGPCRSQSPPAADLRLWVQQVPLVVLRMLSYLPCSRGVKVQLRSDEDGQSPLILMKTSSRCHVSPGRGRRRRRPARTSHTSGGPSRRRRRSRARAAAPRPRGTTAGSGGTATRRGQWPRPDTGAPGATVTRTTQAIPSPPRSTPRSFQAGRST
jgi:hypothetical protein